MEGQQNTQSQPGLNLDTEILQKMKILALPYVTVLASTCILRNFMEQEKAYQEEQEEKNNEIFLNVLNNPEKEITEIRISKSYASRYNRSY
mgnify:CR=1 FL=1